MLGGFSFKGIHSSDFGVYETPGERVLSPLKRRSLIEIPGRSTAFIQEDGGYQPRVESIFCSYGAQDGISLQKQVRLIAGWLDGVGELVYDYEPEMHYYGFLSSPPPTVKQLQFATFDLEFTLNHPFAYETAQQKVFNIANGQIIKLETNGTVPTPIRLVIRNTGTRKITNIVISAKYISN